MEDNRKLAVAFGSFACVVEGYDNPFQIVQDVVRFFENQAEVDPEFGGWATVADVDELKAMLEASDSEATLDITTMPGGLRVRRLLDDAAPAAAATPLMAALAEEEEETDVTTEPPVEAVVSETGEDADTGMDDEDVAADLAMAFGSGTVSAQDDTQAPKSEDESEEDSSSDVEPEALSEAYAKSPDYDAPFSDSSSDTTVEPWSEEPLPTSETEGFDTGSDLPAYEEPTDKSRPMDTQSEDFSVDTGDGWTLDNDGVDSAPDTEVTADETVDEQADSAALSATREADEQDMLARLSDMLAPTPLPKVPEDVEPLEDVQGDLSAATAEPMTEAEPEPEPLVEPEQEVDPEPEPEVEAEEPAQTHEDAATLTSVDDEIAAGLRDADLVEFKEAAEKPEVEEPVSPTPLRLGETGATGPMRLTPDSPPMRLGEPAASEEPASGGLFKRRAKASEEDAPAALRLGQESATPPNHEDLPNFIDAIQSDDEEEEALPSQNTSPADTDIVRDIQSAFSADDTADESDAEAEPQTTARKGLRLGGLLKRKSSETEDEAAASPRLVPDEDDADSDAEEAAPRKPGSLLRVVADQTQSGDDPDEGDAKSSGSSGLRSFLRSKPTADEDAMPEEEPNTAAPPKSAKADEEAARVKDRLHASFTDTPEPASPSGIELDDGEEDADPLSPLGFARRASAKSLPELMTAAAAYLNIVESRTTVSRNEIVEVVQQIASDVPLTAEAKVKAVGKLVRSGTLVRLDGGMFMLDDVALQDYRDAMDGAA